MAQAGTVWVDVRGDTRGLLGDIDSAARRAGSALNPLSAGKAVLGDVGQLAGVAALGVGAIGVAAVKTSTEFNASMSGVAAVAGATSAVMDLLREAALEAGAATVFSASEAAVAQQELVKAGVSVADVLGGALTGSLSLAAAGQLELGNAAEIAAQAMNIFKLEGEDVGYIADVLAAGANKSAADVAQLGDALRQGGLLAAQTGLSMEDTVGVLSLFADNALIGSDAGTSLKTMLQRLAPTSEEAAGAMSDLGLSFFDAEGAFVGIEEAAQRMQVAFKDLSDEERSTAMTRIFGSDAVRAANLLYEAGASGVREYTDAVSDEGAALRMAAEQLNNLKGDLEEFSGATETALIRVGDLFDGTNRALVQGATGFVNVFNDFATTPAWGAIEANVRELGESAGGLFDGVSDRLTQFLDGISVAEVDRSFDRVIGTVKRARDAVEGLEPVIGGVGIAFSTMALRSIPFIGQLAPAISPITGLLGGLVVGSEEGRDALAQLGDKAGALAREIGPDLMRSLSSLADELSVGLASVLEDVGEAAVDAARVLGPVLGDAISDLAPVVGDLIEVGGELVAEILPVLADLAGVVLPPAVDLLGGALGLAADATSILTDNLWLLVPALSGVAAVKFGDQISGWGSAIGGVAGAAKTAGSDFATYFGVLRSEGQNIGGAFKGAAAEVGGLSGGLSGLLNPALVGVTAAITVGAGVYQAWSTNVKRVEEETRALSDALIEQGENVLPTLSQQFRDILDTRNGFGDAFEATGLSIAAVSEVINANTGDMDEFRKNWQFAGEQVELFRESGKRIPEGVRPIIDSLFAMNEAGTLTDDELRAVIDAMTDLDKGALVTAGNVGFLAEQMKTSLANEGVALAGQALKDFNTAVDDNAPLTDRRDALARLAAQYPEVAAAAGVAVGEVATGTDALATEAARAAGEIRALADELDELAGVERDVNEASRRLKDSVQGVLDSYARNGAGIDENTEAGRRNADAIQSMVESAEALAEAQSKTDTTGQAASGTYQQLVDDLYRMKEAGVITGDEYQRLLDLYDLTPEEIATKVEADTAEAKTDLEDLSRRILETPGVTEAEKVMLQAALDQGAYGIVKVFLDNLARDRTATITTRVTTTSGRSYGSIDSAYANEVEHRATGGAVWPGTPFIVGEEGPELGFFPASGGMVDAQTTERILSPSKAEVGAEFGTALLDEFRALRTEMAALASRPTFGSLVQNGVEPRTAPEDLVRGVTKAHYLVGS